MSFTCRFDAFNGTVETQIRSYRSTWENLGSEQRPCVTLEEGVWYHS